MSNRRKIFEFANLRILCTERFLNSSTLLQKVILKRTFSGILQIHLTK